MAPRRNKKRMKLNADRLSNLPDDIIHKILSFVGMKAVVRTSSLSSRWRFLWTSMPYLLFSSRAYRSKQKFCQSVYNVLRGRNNQIQMSSLYLRTHSPPSDAFFNRVLDYAFSHNIQELTIVSTKEFHLFDFSSESLKVLTLSGIKFDYYDTSTSNWELPALTKLHLIGVTLYDDEELDEAIKESWEEFFSNCPNLKYLTLDECSIGGGGFRICHPQLSDLKLANGVWELDCVFVDTPQLKNLAIINCDFVYLYPAPELTSLIYRHRKAFEFDVKYLPSLEKVDLCVYKPRWINSELGNILDIFPVLQKFQSVKFLTINVEILELLSSLLESELVSVKPSPFANLKSLIIYPAIIDGNKEEDEEDEDEEDEDAEDEDEEEDEDEYEEDNEANISAKVKNFFLNSSPSATVTKVTCQEIKAVTTPELVTNLMEELQVLLKEEKAKINMAHKKRGKTPIQVMKKMQLLTEERVLTIESRWKDPSVQNYLENGNISPMVSKLQVIKGVLATLPTSKRGDMKACFRRLFAEANLVMKKIDDASSHNVEEERVEERLLQNQEDGETGIKDDPNSKD